jgi:hypothetical protein
LRLANNTDIEIVVSDAVKGYLENYYYRTNGYVDHLSKTFGLDANKLEVFEGEKPFGYNGLIHWNEEQSVISFSYSKDESFLLSCSLYLLFKILSFEPVEPDAKLPISINLELTQDTGGCAIGADFSAEFHRWLGEKYTYGSERKLPGTIVAMLQYGELVHEIDGWRGHVSAEMSEIGGFAMHCDRNCCCMRTGQVDEGAKFSLSSHNCDNSANQLTFLAGLAQLSQEFSNDQKGFILRDEFPLFLYLIW